MLTDKGEEILATKEPVIEVAPILLLIDKDGAVIFVNHFPDTWLVPGDEITIEWKYQKPTR